VDVPIGNAANGMCGGMVFTVRDFYESGFPLPGDTNVPTGGALFDYLSKRLFDSFDLPVGPGMYMHLMNPDLPDHETDASRAGLAPRGRAWVMVNDQWPAIKSDLDSGTLSPMALIRVKSHDPFLMGHNHQVLAYGYSINGSGVRIYVYDPNHPDDDSAYVEFSTADPEYTTEVRFFTKDGIGNDDEVMNCFFRTGYKYSTPPPGAPHVNGVSSCPFPNGTPDCDLLAGGPFKTVSQGVQASPEGGIVLIRVGPYLENLTINKLVTLRSWGGPVIIGQ